MNAAMLPYAAVLALMLSVFLAALGLLRLMAGSGDTEALRQRMLRARGLRASAETARAGDSLRERVLA